MSECFERLSDACIPSSRGESAGRRFSTLKRFCAHAFDPRPWRQDNTKGHTLSLGTDKSIASRNGVGKQSEPPHNST